MLFLSFFLPLLYLLLSLFIIFIFLLYFYVNAHFFVSSHNILRCYFCHQINSNKHKYYEPNKNKTKQIIWLRSSYRKKKRKLVRRTQSVAEFTTETRTVSTAANKRHLFR